MPLFCQEDAFRVKKRSLRDTMRGITFFIHTSSAPADSLRVPSYKMLRSSSDATAHANCLHSALEHRNFRFQSMRIAPRIRRQPANEAPVSRGRQLWKVFSIELCDNVTQNSED